MATIKIDPRDVNLQIITTLGCPNSCQHCCFSCSPQKSKYYLALDDMKDILKHASELGILDIGLNGGEPFTKPKELMQLVVFSSGLDIDLAIRTSGGWALDERLVFETVRFLKVNQVGRLGLSYDPYHAEYVDKSCILRIIRECESQDLPVWVDWVSAGGKKAFEISAEVKQTLGIYSRYVRSHTDNLRCIGDRCNKSDLADFDFRNALDLLYGRFSCGYEAGTMQDDYTLIVYPENLVQLGPCCLPNFIRHRPKGSDWMRVLFNLVAEDELENIVYQEGPRGIVDVAKRKGLDALRLAGSKYTSTCELCIDISPYFWDGPSIKEKMFSDLGRVSKRKSDIIWSKIADDLRDALANI